MSDMRLVIVGAAGRMGRTLVRLVDETDGVTLAGALEHAGSAHLGVDIGSLVLGRALGIPITVDPLKAIVSADGVIDFSTPDTTLAIAALAAQARIVHVIGTTGFGPDADRKLAAAARHATIIKSGNMSVGVNLLAALARRAAAVLADFDVEIVEMHHRMKVDAPSGTALLLGEAIAKGRGVSLADQAVRGRDGLTGARPPGAIGFASLRGGSVVGDHSVILAGDGERIELVHKAEDRAIFARGAVRAALWGRGRKPGLFSMDDVIGAAIDGAAAGRS